jgi:Tfp pilus assembly protein PilX
MSRSRQRGVSLVAVLFMIVVLGAFAAFAVRLSAAGDQDLTTQLLSGRATFAARSGLEYAANRALMTPRTNTCALHATAALNGVPITLTQGSLNGFVVTVQFNCTIHDVGGVSYEAFDLVSTATRGTYGNPDYVSRRVTRVVTNAP